MRGHLLSARTGGRLRAWLPVLVAVVGPGLGAALADDAGPGLHVCVANYHQGYFDQEFEEGSVTLPAGAVFEFDGNIKAGNRQEPVDDAHRDEMPEGSTGERVRVDATWRAFVTTAPATVSKGAPCVTVPAKTVISKLHHWAITKTPDNPARHYTLIGAVRNGQFTGSAWGEKDRQGHAEYFATVHDPVTDSVVLDDGPG